MTQVERRDLWAKLHRWFGLTALAFLAAAGLTGSILCFAQSLDHALNADLTVRSSSGASPPPLHAVAALQAKRPDLQVLSFPLHVPEGDTIPVDVSAMPGQPALAYDQLFLDGATGDIAGERLKGPGWDRRHLVEGIREFHFNLLAGDWGRWWMGVMALGWFLTNFAGVYLTWPYKRPYLAKWRRMWRFSLKGSLGRVMLDIHRATGLWLLPALTILAFSSVCLNFYSEAYEPAVTRLAPLKYSLFDQPAPFPGGTVPRRSYVEALVDAQTQARREGMGWRPATMLYRPDWNLYGVTFTNDGLLNYRALGPVYLYFDAETGRFRHRVDPYVDSAGLKLIRLLYPLHSGQIAGWPTVAIICLLGLATVETTITGLVAWLKKRKPKPRTAAAKSKRLAQPATDAS